MKNIIQKIAILIALLILTTIQSYAYVSDCFISVAPKEIEYHLVNPNGLITGYTPNGILSQIPALPIYVYHMSTGPEPESQKPPYEKYHTIEVQTLPVQIQPGKYRLVLYGAPVNTLAEIDIELSWSENIKWKGEHFAKHLIYQNSIWTFEFDIPAIAPTNGQIVLTKVSTPADLIKDLTAAGQLGYIGNAKFVSELVKEINEIEAEKAKGKMDDGLTPTQKAKKEYTELLKEITEKYNKPEGDEFVKQEAYTVLKEDMEYIIGHI